MTSFTFGVTDCTYVCICYPNVDHARQIMYHLESRNRSYGSIQSQYSTIRYAFPVFTRRLNVSTLAPPCSMSAGKVELRVQANQIKFRYSQQISSNVIIAFLSGDDIIILKAFSRVCCSADPSASGFRPHQNWSAGHSYENMQVALADASLTVPRDEVFPGWPSPPYLSESGRIDMPTRLAFYPSTRQKKVHHEV